VTIQEVLTGHEADQEPAPLGTELPEGARFIGPIPGLRTGWFGTDVPSDRDLDTCVACGLCLPHCPTYRLTGEESASPRGRIAAIRAVNDGIAEVDDTFASFMDLCLACRACEDVCPSHVPFGRMMERARVQIEPLRTRRARFVRRLGLDVVLPRKKLLWLVAAFQPLARPFMGNRLRGLVPKGGAHLGRLPAVTDSVGEVRGTVALLSGCVQDRWFREVNLATIRVLARNGWRVVVPRSQVCCGALPAHNGRLGTARRLARKNVRAFAKADAIVVNAAGCGAHMQEVGDLLSTDETGAEAAHAFGAKVIDVMAFLDEHGIEPPAANPGVERVAYHDACHALRVQHVREQPRALLRQIPGLEVLDIANGDRCCGAAGLYNVTQPETADELQRQKVEAILATGAMTVASANPGCTMQISAGLRAAGRSDVEVLHPIQLLDRAEST
jgi:glycolate oxidase iron-sulfur subunit